MSHADELLAAFNKAEQPKQQIAALEQIIKSHEQFKEPEKQLQPIIVAIENSAARNQRMHPELAFELIIARDDLLARVPSLHTTHIGLTLSKADCGRGKAPDIDPAKLAGGKRETSSASVALRARSFMDRSRLTFDGGEPRSHGGANPAHLERNRASTTSSG